MKTKIAIIGHGGKGAQVAAALARAAQVQPIVSGHDILRSEDTFAERCVRFSAAARDRLIV